MVRTMMRTLSASVMVLAVLLLLMATPVLAFTDVPANHPYAAAIADLSTREIISGYDDGSFGPEKPVWRQHFAKMIVLTLDIPCTEADVCPFSDVYAGFPGDLYPDHYVAVCAAQGITQGTSPGHFSPEANISRAQVVTMVVRALEALKPGALRALPNTYPGTLGDFSDTHAAAMREAEYNGLLHGLAGFGASWDPWAPATRGDVAQLLHNVLGLLEGTTPPQPSGLEVPVTHVGDGDTVHVLYQGRDESLRLIGLDTPETGEPFAAQATAALQALVGGRQVRLEFDVEERDQYQRLLAYVWVGSTLANAEMLRLGWATVYTVPPNVQYVSTLQAAENEAKKAKRGVWAGAATSPLQIATLHPDAAGNDNFNLNDEWIEFRVLVSGTLQGYSVEDATGHHYNFPDRIFQQGQLFKLHTGSGSDTQTDLYWGASGSAIWNNDGDTVKVLDPQGHVVASRSY
jgi:micrococcal nuclease